MKPTIEDRLSAIATLCVRKVQLAESPTVPAEDALVAVGVDDSSEESGEAEGEEPAEVAADEQTSVEKAIVVPIVKAVEEEQTVTGIVLTPEVVDGHGDIMSAKVIKDSAFNFLASFNKVTKLGVQHSVFKKGQLELVESFIAPMNMVIGSKTVKAGAWVMTVRVLDKKLWAKVKSGQITGFSIGGIAQAVPLAA